MTLEQVFEKVFGVPSAEVHDQLSLQDIPSWDSMSHMMLILQLEEAFGRQLSGDQIADMQTVGDARRAVSAEGVLR